jgi:hypothetical protein
MRRFVGIAAVGALAVTGLGLSSPAQSAVAPKAASAATTTLTNFGLAATGYGTKVLGRDLGVNSGPTAYNVLACTRLAGLERTNNVTNVNIGTGTNPLLAHAHAVNTHTWTTSHRGTVSSWSQTKIVNLDIGGTLATTPPSLPGTLRIDSVVATTRAWHNSTGFHSSARTSIAGINFIVAGQVIQSFNPPTAGNPVTVPGIAKLSVGYQRTAHSRLFGMAKALSLAVYLIPTGTQINVGYAYSRIDGNVTGGIFKGFGNASQVDVANGSLTSGRTGLQPMPCAGTGGKTLTNATASVTLGGVIKLYGAEGAANGVERIGSAHGYTKGSIARAMLDNGNLAIKGIVGKANVRLLAGGRTIRNARGTTIASIMFNGRSRRIPTAGHPLRLLGVATIYAPQVYKTRHGIDVTAVRIDILNGNGQGSTVSLGHAILRITSR